MSLVSERDGFFGWRQVDDPYSLGAWLGGGCRLDGLLLSPA